MESSVVRTIRTSLSQLLRIDLPIVQAPIGDATSPALAAAVSNAGGLGTLAMSFEGIDAMRQSIRETRSLTNHPFGVNLILNWPQEERLKVCLEEGVGVVSFFWGDPSPYVKAIHSVGARVMHTISSAKEARQAVDAGVDIIVAQGWEAGGHVWGEGPRCPWCLEWRTRSFLRRLWRREASQTVVASPPSLPWGRPGPGLARGS